MGIFDLFVQLWNHQDESFLVFVMIWAPVVCLTIGIVLELHWRLVYEPKLRQQAKAWAKWERDQQLLEQHRQAHRDFHSEVEAWQAAVKQLEGKNRLKLADRRG